MAIKLMNIVLVSFFIKSAIFERGFVSDVHINKKFKCGGSFKEIFTVKSEIECSHRCLRRSCSRLNYNVKKGEKENCEVFPKVDDCSIISGQDDWKAANFKVEIHVRVHLEIIIASYGKNDPGFFQNNHSIIINGVATAPSFRGFNVAVISPSNGYILGVGSFDTYGQMKASAAMISFINKYPNGSILCIAVSDSGNDLTQDGIDYLAGLGSIDSSSIQWRTSFAMLTAKDVSKPAWFAEMHADVGKGPSILKSSLRF